MGNKMKNSRLRATAALFIVIPSSFLISREHARAVRTRHVAELKALLERSWLEPLGRNQSAAELSEYDGVTALARQPGVSCLVYFNKYAEVRWSEDPAQTTKELFEYSQKVPLPNSVVDAHTVRLPIVRPLPDGRSSIAIPLIERGFVQGLVYFEASDAALDSLLTKADRLFPPPAPRTMKSGDHINENSAAAQQAYISGLIYYQRSDIARAKEKWRQAIALDPDNEDAREGLQRL